MGAASCCVPPSCPGSVGCSKADRATHTVLCPAAHDAAVLQALLSLAASLVRAARESSSADTCSQLLDALDTKALLRTLSSAIVANEEAAYATRLAAVKLLGELVGCVGDTWRYQGSSPGKLESAARC